MMITSLANTATYVLFESGDPVFGEDGQLVTLRWTDQAPNSEGLYLFSSVVTGTCVGLNVTLIKGEYWVGMRHVTQLSGLWLGPIPQPPSTEENPR